MACAIPAAVGSKSTFLVYSPTVFAALMEHGFDAAVAEYERLVAAYPALGYEITVLPKVGVAERAELILRILADSCSSLSDDQ